MLLPSRRLVRLVTLAAVGMAAFSLLNCNDGSGPVGRAVSFAVLPTFESSMAGIVPLASARVTLTRSGGEVALDTVVGIAPGSDSLELNLQVHVFSATETFSLTLAFRDSLNATVFVAGPVEVMASTSGSAQPTAVPLVVTYVGTGANAASVEISTEGANGIEGDQVLLVAIARDSSGNPIPGTPVGWQSLDPNRGTFPNQAVGSMLVGSERGAARVEAMLITGQADTGSVDVQPRPSTVTTESGGNQTGTVGTELEVALVARVTAADGLPVTGIDVTFAPGAGQVSNPTATTNATGHVQTQWILGTLAGAQNVVARVTRFPTATNTFGATATPDAIQTVTVTPPVASVLSIGATQQYTGTATDQFGNVVGGQTFDWTSLNEAVATVNPATGLATAVANGTATIQADLGGLLGTATLTVGQAATNLAFTMQPSNTTAGGTIAPAIQVTARDANLNPVTTFTGNVTLAISTNPGGGTLSGMTTVAAVNGVATFGTLSINNAGTGYRLQATATGLTAGTSDLFNITAAAPAARHWIAGNGDWTTAANWSGGVVPGPGDTAIIDAPGTYGVSMFTPVTVARLVLGGASGNQGLGVDGPGSLTTTDGVLVAASGVLVVGGAGTGILLAGGAIVNEGQLHWVSGTIAGANSLQNEAGATLLISSSIGTTLSQRSLTNFGQIFFNSTADLTLTGNAQIDNLIGSTFDIMTDADIVQGTGASFSNGGGLVRKTTTPGVTTIDISFLNFGVIEVLTGTLEFTGTALTNNTGATMRGTGTFDVSGTGFTNAGRLEAGLSPGQLGVTGAVSQQSTALIVAELGGTQVGTEYDRIAVTGAVTLGGTLDLQVINGFQPQVGDSLTILTFASRSGNFGSVTGMDIGGGLRLDTAFTATSLSIVVRDVGGGGTISWTNPAGGNWSDGANWSTGIAPGAADEVVIDLTGTYTVTLDVNPTVASLTLGAATGILTVTGTGRTLTVNGDINVGETATLSLATSTVTGTGTLINQGAFILRDGQLGATIGLNNQGVATFRGISAINGPVVTLIASVLRVEGEPAGGGAQLTVANGFVNEGLIQLTSTSAGFSSSLLVTAGTLVNEAGGTIHAALGAGGARALAVELDNRGQLTVDQALGLARADAEHVNSGTIDIIGAANLTITQTGTAPSFTSTGIIALGANRRLIVNGGTLDLTAGATAGPGTSALNFTGGILAFDPGTLTVPLTLSGVAIAGGAVIIEAAETLTLLNAGLADPVTILDGGILLGHGNNLLNGALSMPDAGSVLRIEGDPTGGTSSFAVANGFTNNGIIELTSTSAGFSSSFTVVTGTLTNAAGGSIVASVGAGGARTLAAQLDNQGLVDINQALNLARAGSVHTNSGTIDVTAAADFTLTQTGTTPSFGNQAGGTVTLGANRIWTITGGTVDVTAGTVTGVGTSRFVMTGGTLAFDPATLTLPLTLTTVAIAGGSVTVENGETLILLGGGLSDPVTVQDGGLLLTHGTVTLTGALSLPATGSVLRAEGDPTGGTSTLTVANGFVNNGQIELTSVSAGFTASVAVTAGALTNSGIGVIRILPGAGGARTLAAELDNQGTVTLTQPLTLARADADHLNTGTIDATGANFTLTQTGTTPSFNNPGTVLIGTTRIWTINGGTLTVSSGFVTGTGTARLIMTGGTLAFDPATLTLPLTLTTVAIAGGTVTVGSGETLTLLGGGLIDPVTVESGGLLLTHGAVSLAGAVTMPTGAILRVEGDPTGGTSSLTIADGFTSNGLIELTSVSAGFTSSLTVTNGTLTNAAGATIHSQPGAGGARTLAAQLDNQGLVDIDQPLTLARAGSVHVNNAMIDATNANFTLTQTGTTPGFTNTGTVTIGTTRIWTISGGTLTVTAGIVAGTGTARVIMTGGTLDFDPGTLTLPLTLTTVAITGGSVIVGSGETLTLLDGGLIDPVTVEAGGLLLTHGAVSLTGALSLPAATSLLRVEGDPTGGTATLTVANGFTNSGQIVLTSVSAGFTSILAVTTGTLVNAGTILSDVGAGGARTLAAQLDNQNLVDIDQPLTLARASSAHSNSATIDATNANFTLTQTGTTPSFTNIGAVSLGAARVWTVTGGTVDVTAGSVTGAAGARFVMTGGTLAFDPATLTLPLTLTTVAIMGGAVTVGADETLTLLDGGLSDPVTVEDAAQLLVHGAVSLTGAVNLPNPGSVLRVQGDPSGGTATLTIANGFTNNGLIELTSASAGFTAVLAVTNGTLVNAATILSDIGAGGARTLAAELDNQGLLDINQPLTLNRASAAHTNTGTIDVTGTANFTVTQTGIGPIFANTGPGVIAFGSGRIWTVTGGTLDLAGGQVNGPLDSRLAMTGGTLIFNPGSMPLPLTLSGVALAGGSLLLADGDQVTLLDGGISDPVTLEGGAELRVHGAVSLTGTLNNDGDIIIEGDPTGGTATLTVATGFTNTGLIALTSTNAGFTSSLVVTNGTLTNMSGGTISSQVGAGGARTLNAQIDNQAGIEVDAALTLNRADANHINSGQIDLTNANLTVTQTGTAPTLTNTGVIIIGATRTLIVTGGQFLNAGPAAGLIQGSGTLNVTGTTFSNAGDVGPGNAGAAGTLTVTGNYPQSATGVTNIELGGAALGQFDRILVSGTATLGGTLTVTLINGFNPTNGVQFSIMTYPGGPPADFAVKNLPGACTGAPGIGQYLITCP